MEISGLETDDVPELRCEFCGKQLEWQWDWDHLYAGCCNHSSFANPSPETRWSVTNDYSGPEPTVNNEIV